MWQRHPYINHNIEKGCQIGSFNHSINSSLHPKYITVVPTITHSVHVFPTMGHRIDQYSALCCIVEITGL